MLHTISIVFDIGLLALLAYVGITFYMQYRKQTDGSTFMRALAAAKGSATILWSQFCIALACVVGQLDNLADMLGQPEIKDFINTWVGNPKFISGIMLIIAIVTIKARLRPASADQLK